jgi:hypothetical protein
MCDVAERYATDRSYYPSELEACWGVFIVQKPDAGKFDRIDDNIA